MWTGENDTNTILVDAYFFENGKKKLRFQMKTDTCGRGLSKSKAPTNQLETKDMAGLKFSESP